MHDRPRDDAWADIRDEAIHVAREQFARGRQEERDREIGNRWHDIQDQREAALPELRKRFEATEHQKRDREILWCPRCAAQYRATAARCPVCAQAERIDKLFAMMGDGK